MAARRLTGQWPNAHLKLVEDKANGPAVIQSLRHEIGGLVEVNPEGGKMSRAAAASPQLESGNWYFAASDAETVGGRIHNAMRGFPGRGER